MPQQTISDAVHQHSNADPSRPAILAVDAAPLTYADLDALLSESITTLAALGYGCGSRAAIVMPNGPQMATLFLVAASALTAAPLNPNYKFDEFKFYLEDLHADVLLIEQGIDSPARDAANALQIPIIEVDSSTNKAGEFTLHGGGFSPVPPAVNSWADTALILHTSGTTSRPKIVPLTLGNLLTSTSNIRQSLALTPEDRCLNVMPLFHIHGLIGALLSSITAGASVICTTGFFATEFWDWLDTFKPTWYTAVPTMHQGVIARAEQNQAIRDRVRLRFVRSSSASLPIPVLHQLEATFNAPVVEAYGMTEASHQIAINPLPPGKRKPGSVGKPFGVGVAILDPAGVELPQETEGEISIRGGNVTLGYENAPQANATAFSGGWLRTGDQGKLDTDGYVFITGRLKELINRGGEKISPREVDDVLLAHPAIAQAAAFAMPHPTLGEDVAAVVVLRPGMTLTEAELSAFAGEQLAYYKVPHRILIRDEIPKGATGKIQRVDLAVKLGITLSDAEAAPRRAFIAPRTPLETQIAAVWSEVLRIEPIGVDDDFLSLGGDSMLAMRVVHRLRERLAVDLSINHLLETPTVASVAQLVEHLLAAKTSDNVRHVLVRSTETDAPLSFAQESFWFRDQLTPGTPAANSPPQVWRLRGVLQIDVLQHALDQLVQRHEPLRTTFGAVNGIPYQSVSAFRSLPLRLIDLYGQPVEGVATLIDKELARGFDITHDLLIRATLFRLAKDDHVLLLIVHHLAYDHSAGGVLYRDLTAFYDAYVSGSAPVLPDLGVRYVDYARWQHQRLADTAFQQHLDYWHHQLSNVSPLALPTIHSHSANQTDQGAVVRWSLPPDRLRQLEAFSQKHNATLFMTLLATFQTLLYRYTGETDIAVGSLISTRDLAELEPLVGIFLNTLVLRTHIDPDEPFPALLAKVRQTTLDAFAHQVVPYEHLVASLATKRTTPPMSLFQVLFNFESDTDLPISPLGLDATRIEHDLSHVMFDLTMEVTRSESGLAGFLEYKTNLFDQHMMERLTEHYLMLLANLDVGTVATMPLLTEPERQQILVEWNKTDQPYPRDATIHEMFQAQVARTPHALAIRESDRRINFTALDLRANGIAHQLIARGLPLGGRVGVLLPRSADAVAAMLGILKAGGAFVPLDPSYPAERIQFMLADSDASFVITNETLAQTFSVSGAILISSIADNDQPPVLESRPTADSTAYVLYTSGSTGKPKGVVGMHRGVIARLHWMWRAYPFAPNEVSALKTSLNFIDSLWEIFGALLDGIPVTVIDDTTIHDVPALIDHLANESVTRLWLVPTLLRTLLEQPGLAEKLPLLRFWVTSGEALPTDIFETFNRLMPGCILYNLYGTSETWDATWYVPNKSRAMGVALPIGKPIDNVRVYVLDNHLQPVPIGITGELFVAGDSLSEGYLNTPEQTAQRFLVAPFKSGERLYRTGDLVHYLPDGNLQYLGRRDRQVKIGGFRIELGEIEDRLMQHHAVSLAAVKTWQDLGNRAHLVAYLPVGAERGNVLAFLREHLPPQMIPDIIVNLPEMPLTPSGKIDRLSLPDPVVAPNITSASTDLLAIEQWLIAIWKDILGVENPGTHASFFELGGHSLLVLQLLARIERQLGAHLSPAQLYENPTIAGIAATLRQHPSAWSLLLPIQPSGSRTPLFGIHAAGGGAFYYQRYLKYMNPDQPFYGLMARGMDGISPLHANFVEMARDYVAEIRKIQPHGPYMLSGYSLGATVALEMASQLRAAGEQVSLLALIDPPFYLSRSQRLAKNIRNALIRRVRKVYRALTGVQLVPAQSRYPEEERELRLSIHAHLDTLHQHWMPSIYGDAITIYVGKWRFQQSYLRSYLAQWRTLSGDKLTIVEVPGETHIEVNNREDLSELLAALNTSIAQAQPR